MHAPTGITPLHPPESPDLYLTQAALLKKPMIKAINTQPSVDA